MLNPTFDAGHRRRLVTFQIVAFVSRWFLSSDTYLPSTPCLPMFSSNFRSVNGAFKVVISHSQKKILGSHLPSLLLRSMLDVGITCNGAATSHASSPLASHAMQSFLQSRIDPPPRGPRMKGTLRVCQNPPKAEPFNDDHHTLTAK